MAVPLTMLITVTIASTVERDFLKPQRFAINSGLHDTYSSVPGQGASLFQFFLRQYERLFLLLPGRAATNKRHNEFLYYDLTLLRDDRVVTLYSPHDLRTNIERNQLMIIMHDFQQDCECNHSPPIRLKINLVSQFSNTTSSYEKNSKNS